VTAAAIAVAMVLDAIFGEPRWLWSRIPHPAIVIGRAIGWLDVHLNTGTGRKMRGFFAVTLLIIAALLIAAAIRILSGGPTAEIALAAILLAQRSLVTHVGDVANNLRISTAEGRTAVAHIVGRDTAGMDQTAIVRGAIESASENMSDGVIAPIFWFLIAGLPGLLIYKVINTADSMIGYKTRKYAAFGYAAARLDDLVNWVPARLTAMLIALAHFRPDIGALVRRDAGLHRSPNAGWPEAAMAVCLNISLAGPRSYGGETREFPLVHPEGNANLGPTDIDRAVTALWKTWWLTLALIIILAVV